MICKKLVLKYRRMLYFHLHNWYTTAETYNRTKETCRTLSYNRTQHLYKLLHKCTCPLCVLKLSQNSHSSTYEGIMEDEKKNQLLWQNMRHNTSGIEHINTTGIDLTPNSWYTIGWCHRHKETGTIETWLID